LLHLLAGHFSWGFLTRLQAEPTENCTSAHSTYPFANFRGSLSNADLANKTLYTTGPSNSTYGYYPQDCSLGRDYICEVPQSNWLCPPSPPAPTLAPDPCQCQPCEWQQRAWANYDCGLGSMARLRWRGLHASTIDSLCPPPGLPQDTEILHCNASRGSCYRYITSSETFSKQKTACSGLNGYVVAWNSYEEQLEVESYFSGRGASCLHYDL
jgi:hypothetical protein